ARDLLGGNTRAQQLSRASVPAAGCDHGGGQVADAGQSGEGVQLGTARQRVAAAIPAALRPWASAAAAPREAAFLATPAISTPTTSSLRSQTSPARSKTSPSWARRSWSF